MHDIGAIVSFKISLSSGPPSKPPSIQFGKCFQVNNSFDFPDDRPIRSVRVRHTDNWVWSMQFIDSQKEIILEIKGDDAHGEWDTVELREREEIIGIQARETDLWMLAIGFLTIIK